MKLNENGHTVFLWQAMMLAEQALILLGQEGWEDCLLPGLAFSWVLGTDSKESTMDRFPPGRFSEFDLQEGSLASCFCVILVRVLGAWR